MEFACSIEPTDGAVSLEMSVLDALRAVDAFVDNVGLRKAELYVADAAMNFSDDIALAPGAMASAGSNTGGRMS